MPEEAHVHAFEVMYVCVNEHCPAYGHDTPDWAPGDIRCLMCATSKDHWTRIPFEKICPLLQRFLRRYGLHE